MVGISPQEMGTMFWGADGGRVVFPAMPTSGDSGAVKSEKGVCVVAVRFALLHS